MGILQIMLKCPSEMHSFDHGEMVGVEYGHEQF